MDTFSPIVIFAFNRPDLLEQTLIKLVGCNNINHTEIHFFIDGPRHSRDESKILKCEAVIIRFSKKFYKTFVHKNQKNLGLAVSLKHGITKILKAHDSVIVLEDDLLVESCFIDYMNAQLKFYKKNKSVGSISGFSTKIPQVKYFNYFHPRPTSWGWATWSDRWEQAIWSIDNTELKNLKEQKALFNKGGEDLYRMLVNQFYGKIDSWAIYWAYTHYKHGWSASCPSKSLVLNIGFGENATHCKGINPFPSEIYSKEFNFKDIDFQPVVILDENIIRKVNKYHSNLFKIFIKVSEWLR